VVWVRVRVRVRVKGWRLEVRDRFEGGVREKVRDKGWSKG
jgi:hypothetical protein